jgi:hypothetical protein
MREWRRPAPASRSLSSDRSSPAQKCALAVEHGGAHGVRQVLERVAHGQNEAIVERVALGGRVQADDGDVALEIDAKVCVRHDCVLELHRLFVIKITNSTAVPP